MSVSNDIVLRGEEAARARPIDLIAPQAPLGLDRSGPFAAHLEEAYAEARKEGFLRGRMEGYDLAQREGLEEARQRAGQALAALDVFRTEVEERMAELCAQLGSEVTNLALEIAEAILEREITTATDPGAEAIARCLDLAPDLGDVVAHLNPDDVELLDEVTGLRDRNLHVVPDPRLDRGDAVVRVDDSLIDGRVAAALERVAEVLR